ncbi:MAG: hypothetical protein K2M78_16345 [Lachnospiraceae bacterium]|nr:hypothetical protein [Lachnospiraceae bacterium]
MKNVLKQIIGALICCVVGIWLLIGDIKFYIDMGSGNYEEVSATVVDYKKHTKYRKRGRTSAYSKIYEYKEDGEIKRYESSKRSNIGLGSVGDKAVLYRNIKTHKVREKPFKTNMMIAIILIVLGIFNMFMANRPKNRQADNSD